MGIIWRWKIQLYARDWHSRKFQTKNLGVLQGDFWGVWVSKRCPDALLATTLYGTETKKNVQVTKCSHLKSSLWCIQGKCVYNRCLNLKVSQHGMSKLKWLKEVVILMTVFDPPDYNSKQLALHWDPCRPSVIASRMTTASLEAAVIKPFSYMWRGR